jgi:hypothetical protein
MPLWQGLSKALEFNRIAGRDKIAFFSVRCAMPAELLFFN